MCLPAGWTGEGKIAQEAKPCIRNKHTYSEITSHAVAGYGLLEEDFLSRRSSSCLWGLLVWASQVLSDNERRSHSTKCLLLVLAREPSFLAGVCWLLSRGALSFRLPAGREHLDDPLLSAMAWAETPTARYSFWDLFPQAWSYQFSRSPNQIWVAISSSFSFRWRVAIKLQAKSLNHISKISWFAAIKTNPTSTVFLGPANDWFTSWALQNWLTFC